ncbi:tyrosine-type recombinase/integrase [Streptomyces acidiscabies]|uniref:tyrosine-type recombinase/integrase n=1 Tax=Streptomyces acidiscabies TaxID=42234 RepID=UPI0038F7E731
MATVFQKCKTDEQNKNYPCEGTRCGHPWTVRYREPGGRSGRQREKSFPLKKQAEAHGNQMENDKSAGVYLDPDRGKITVKAWWDEWLGAQVLRPNTLRDYKGFAANYLIPTLGRKTIAGVTPNDAQRVIAAMAEAGLMASTIETRAIPMRAMFKAAVENDRISKDPCRALKLPRAASKAVDPDEIPTLPEVRQIADEMPAEYRLNVWLMSGAGLRPSEAFGASEDCQRGDVYRVYRQATDKGDGKGNRKALVPLKHRAEGDYRETPLARWLDKEISEHKEEHGVHTVAGGSGLLFITTTGTLFTHENFFHYWQKIMKKLGLSYKPHHLRHFFASTMLAAGCSLLEVSRWLGHKSIRITADTYGHLVPDSWNRGRKAMEDAMKPHLRTIEGGAPTGPEDVAQAA